MCCTNPIANTSPSKHYSGALSPCKLQQRINRLISKNNKSGACLNIYIQKSQTFLFQHLKGVAKYKQRYPGQIPSRKFIKNLTQKLYKRYWHLYEIDQTNFFFYFLVAPAVFFAFPACCQRQLVFFLLPNAMPTSCLHLYVQVCCLFHVNSLTTVP